MRYVGEPVAIVVAESAYQLADALDAVSVEYDRLAALATAEAALASSARLHEGWPDNTAVVARGAVGDPERAMAGAHLVVRERLRHPRLSAVPIETRGVFAYRDRSAGGLVGIVVDAGAAHLAPTSSPRRSACRWKRCA